MPNTPSSRQKRSTRSGSSSSNITLSDIKSLIDNLRVEVINTLKDEVRNLKETISSLQLNIKALKEDNQRIHEKYSEVDAELRSLQAQQAEATFAITEEVEARLRRRCNVVISGLPESPSNDDDKSDSSKCAKLFEDIGQDATGIVSTYRVGKPSPHKPRLLKVKCEDIELRNSVLKHAKELRNSVLIQHRNIYINPDRTLIEQARFKALMTELKQRKANHENVVIFRDRIVKRRDITNF